MEDLEYMCIVYFETAEQVYGYCFSFMYIFFIIYLIFDGYLIIECHIL